MEQKRTSKKNWGWIAFAFALTLPWLVLRFSGWEGSPAAVAVVSGLAILGSAFLLSWAAEVAQMDVSQSLALAFLALISILPEYAVSMVFTWRGGNFAAWNAGLAPSHPEWAQFADHVGYATANMTGANRLLIGLGWSAVVLIHWLRSRQKSVTVEPGQRTEVGFLAIATLWSFTIPLRREIGMLDLVVLLTLFGLYIWRASKAVHEEPELSGPPVALSTLPKLIRRLATFGFFAWAALVILASAEPFSEGLVQTGKSLHVEEFLLVQWLAPLASESPEFLVASVFALRGAPSLGLGTLISSKVNQWTLLIAMMPLVYSLGFGRAAGLPLDNRQVEEVFLTSAQSAFALAVLLNFEMSIWESFGLIFLFVTQLLFPNPEVRYAFAILYLALTLLIIARHPSRLKNLWSLVRCGR